MPSRPGIARSERLPATAVVLACALAILLLVAGSLAGCGSKAKLDATDADRLLASLDAVQASIDAGQCKVASSQASDLVSRARRAGAKGELRSALLDSARQLDELIGAQCSAGATEDTGETAETGETGATGETGTTTETPTAPVPEPEPSGGGTRPDNQPPVNPPPGGGNDGGGGDEGGNGDDSGGVRVQ